jgi:DNA-binding MltR family transcriptional regulator
LAKRKRVKFDGSDESYRKIGDWQVELRKQNDRGMVIVGGAFIDYLLESTLRAFFVDDPKEADTLIGLEGSIGTFASRTRLAYCLGLIDRDTFDDINKFRKIRNDCAHHFESFSLSSRPVLDRCGAMKIWKELAEANRETEPELDYRVLLSAFINVICAKLHYRAIRLRHAVYAEPAENDPPPRPQGEETGKD